MSNTIKVAAGFSVGNKEPIDDRTRVATIAERDAIVSYRRDIGLECIVQNDGSGNIKKYRLEGGITNSDWKDISENGVIETRSTNATANTIPLRDSNGNFQIKLPQDNIFIGNTFGFAAARPLPFDLAGQGGKAVTVRADLLGYEYKSFPSGSLNTVTVKSGVTGLTATKTGDNVELDATYPSTLVQSATGFKVLKDITDNKLSAATLVAGNNVTISETAGETIGGVVTKRLTIAATNPTWANVQSKPNWTGFMPVSVLAGKANKALMVNPTETGYEYATVVGSVAIDPATTGATANTSGMDVTLAFDYPSAVGATSGFNVVDQITQNTLFTKALRAGTGITITETNSGSTAGSPPIPLKYLTVEATAPVIGTNTQVIFNDGGVLAGNSGFTYDKINKAIKVGDNLFVNPANRGSVIIGSNALPIGFTADPGYNVAIGSKALNEATSQNNTAVGDIAGNVITTGDYNTLYGSASGSKITTGSRNICIGPSSSVKNTSTGNITIGYTCGAFETTDFNDKLLIENNYTRTQNKDYLIEGDFSQRWVKFNGAVRKRVETILNSDVIYSGTITSYTTSQFTDNSANFTSLGLTDFEFSVVLTTGVNAGKVIAIGYNINNTTIGGGSNQTSNLVLPINGESYKLIKTKNIASEKLGTQYEINLTTDDYAFFIPPKATTGADIEFIIKSNPNNKKLYICSNGIDYIYPDNARVTSVKTPHESTLIKYTNSGLVKCTNTLDILQPIKTSTKDLVIDLYSKIYKIDVATATTVTLNVDSSYIPILTNNALTIELHINMTSASLMAFPVNVSWVGGSAPAFNAINNYRIDLRTMNAGTTWLAEYKYTY